jgi:hypothetical protein
LTLILFLALIEASISSHPLGYSVSANGLDAVNFIKSENIKGPVFNNFNIGGYLAYRIYPEKVYVDNRPEAYPASFFTKIYTPMQINPNVFISEDNRYKFNSLVIEHWDQTGNKSVLLSYLVRDPKFSLVYLDPYMLVMLRNSKQNSALIKRFKKSDLLAGINFKKNPAILVKYLFFFEKTGMKDKAEAVFKRLKILDPDLCVLYGYPINETYLEGLLGGTGVGCSLASL